MIAVIILVAPITVAIPECGTGSKASILAMR